MKNNNVVSILSPIGALKRKVLSRLSPRLTREEEASIRTHFLPYDIKLVKAAIVLSLVPQAFMIFNDWHFFGPSPRFYMVASYRALMVIFSLFFLILLRRVKRIVTFDRFMVIWQGLVIFSLLAVNLTRPPEYKMYIAMDVLVTALIYIVYTGNFFLQAILALMFTAADMWIATFMKGMPVPELRAVFAGFFMANGFGLLMFLMLSSARRKEYLSRQTEIWTAEENRRLEAERYRQSRLELVGTVADSVATDFREALNRSMERLESAGQLAEGQSPEELRLKLSEARSALYRAGAICNHLLAFTRRDNIEKTPVNLEQIIRNAVYVCLDGSGIPFSLHLDFDILPVEGDRKLLQEAFANVLSFIRSGKPKGITVRARNISLAEGSRYGKGEFILTKVEDKGEGLSQACIERLFDPLDPARGDGLSLDMPLAYSILKKHGGGIEVESIPGGGTTFFFYLPAADKPKCETLNSKCETEAK